MTKAFHALDLDVLSGEIHEVLKGTGTLTEARTSTIYQRDWEDIWRSYGSGEPAWFGGRKVENLYENSNPDDGTVGVIGSGGVLPTEWSVVEAGGLAIEVVAVNEVYQGVTGVRIRISGSPSSTTTFRLQMSDLFVATIDTTTYTMSQWAALLSGSYTNFVSPLIEMVNTGSNVSLSSVGSTIVRVSATGIPSAPSVRNELRGTLTSGQVVDLTLFIGGAQLENVSGQADQTPSEYVPTTTAAAHKIFGTDRSGVPLASLPWLYGGPAGTNELPRSRDLTNVAWVESGTDIAAFDAVGLEGIANTASTLTDDDAGSLEFTRETIAIVDDSNNHVLRLFVAKDTDETRFPEFQFILSGGTLQDLRLQINTETGALTVRISTGTVASEVNDVGLFWEVLLSVTNNTTGNVLADVRLYPAVTTTFDTTENAATGSIIVGNVELHLNKTIAQVRGSTPIFTSGSTVTVNASDLSFDDANHSDTEGAYFCEFKNVGIDGPSQGGMVGLGIGGRIFSAESATEIIAFDGVNAAVGPAITLAADDTEYKFGLAYGSGNHRVNIDDLWGTAVTYDGIYNNTEGKLEVLVKENFVGDPLRVMLLRNLRRYDLDYVIAQTAIDNMMTGTFPSELTGIPAGFFSIANCVKDPDFLNFMRVQAEGAGVWCSWVAGVDLGSEPVPKGTANLELNIALIQNEAEGSAIWARWAPGTQPENTGNLQLDMVTALDVTFTLI